MHILLLGGTNLTGPHTVRRLHSLGHESVSFTAASMRPSYLRAYVMSTLILRTCRLRLDPTPDVVVHMWAMTEMDAELLVQRFRGVASRAVVISSGDVYRAYGRLTGVESGPPDPIPLAEDAPLRESRYPYRKMAPTRITG